ncbi:MAG: penicillin-binding protein activator LpoB [Desulfotignum sp.]|nr:penicillin-binding protein activator LpoB [Desulfotignum sp.]
MAENKMLSNYLILFMIFIILGGCASTINLPDVKSTLSPYFAEDKYKRVAVYVNNNRNDDLRHVEEEFIKALIKKGYSVPARSDLDLVLQEQNLQTGKITDNSAVTLGKLINVQSIIVVTLNEKEPKVSARMIDIENGEIVWIGNTSSGPYYFARARYLAKTIPPAEDPNNTFNESWDYSKAEGYHRLSFNPKDIETMLIQIKGYADKDTKQRIENAIISKLMENGYRVPSRSDLEAIIREHNFNLSKMSDKALTQIGKLLNSKSMIVVWMGKVGQIRSIKRSRGYHYEYGCTSTVRIIDLEKSEIVWTGSLFAQEIRTKKKRDTIYDTLTIRLVKSGLIPSRK